MLLLFLLALFFFATLFFLDLTDAAHRELEVPRRVAHAGFDTERAPARVGGFAKERLCAIALRGRGPVRLLVEGEPEVVVGGRADLGGRRRLRGTQQRFARTSVIAEPQEGDPAIELYLGGARVLARSEVVLA